MDAIALLEKCLLISLASIQANSENKESAEKLAIKFVKEVKQSAKLTNELKLKKEELQALIDELQHFLTSLKTDDGDSIYRRKLSALRAIDWFSTADQKGCRLGLPEFAEIDKHDRTVMFEQVYVIETSFRNLYQEFIGDDIAIICEHLQNALRSNKATEKAKDRDKSYNEVMRRAVKEKPLTGLEMKQLVALYVNEKHWLETGKVYEKSELIKFLNSKRETVECFLDDARRIRNIVVHGKPLTFVHREKLKIYYEALIEPLRKAFPDITRVNVRSLEKPPPDVMEQYEEDVLRLDSKLWSIKKLILVGLTLFLVMIVISLPVLTPKFLDQIDPARHDIEVAKNSPEKISEIVASYCGQGKVDIIQRIAKLPKAVNGLKTNVMDISGIQLVQLAASNPDRLTACVPLLHQLGWNPNLLSRTTVGNDFDPTNNPLGSKGIPQGYQSYLIANTKGLKVEDTQVEATELHGNPLLYAVWHSDISLVKALLDAGANPLQGCTVGGMWVGENEDVQVLNILDEAKRLGNGTILDLLRQKMSH